MNPLSQIADRYRRWRHTRGFGVHSPIAYRIITEALYLRPPYAYYAEALPALEGDSADESRWGRRIYRLTVLLAMEHRRPPRIYIAPRIAPIVKEAAILAGACVSEDAAEADALLLQPEGHSPANDNDEDKYEELSALFDPSTSLRLTSRRLSIIIPRSVLGPTRYTLP